MFDKMKDLFGQAQMMQQLLKDEHFRAFVSHPKVQELFLDPDFKEIAKSRDFSKILMHPKFTQLMRDPELAQMMSRIDIKKLME